jgi:hypothetical protein
MNSKCCQKKRLGLFLRPCFYPGRTAQHIYDRTVQRFADGMQDDHGGRIAPLSLYKRKPQGNAIREFDDFVLI